MAKYKITTDLVATVSQSQLHSDITDHLEGAEVLNDMSVVNPKLYASMYEVKTLKKYASKSRDNDVNETTRQRIAELYIRVKSCKYLIVTQ